MGANNPITKAVLSGDKVVYNLYNGSTLTFDKGTNPYTGTRNKDAIDELGNLQVFDNGFQPNNINGKPISMIDRGNGTPFTIKDEIGDILRVWKTTDSKTVTDKGSKWNPFDNKKVTKITNKYYRWDAPANEYKELTAEERNTIGLK